MTQAASAWPPSQDQFTLLDRGFGLRPWLEAQHSRDLLHRGRQQIVHIGRAQHATLQTLAMRRRRPPIKINRTRESTQQHICYVMRRCPSSSQRRRFCRTNSARRLPVSHTSSCKLRPVRSRRRSDRPPPSLTASPAFHLNEEEKRNLGQQRPAEPRWTFPKTPPVAHVCDEGRSQHQSAAVAPGNSSSQRSRVRPE